MATLASIWGKDLFDQLTQARLSGKQVKITAARDTVRGTVAAVEENTIVVDTSSDPLSYASRVYVFRDHIASVVFFS